MSAVDYPPGKRGARSLTAEVIDTRAAARHRGGMTTQQNTSTSAGAPSQRSRTSAGERVGAASRRTRRHVHGRAGLLHRQRRAAVDAARPAREQRRDRMGRRRLRAHVRRVPDRRRAARATRSAAAGRSRWASRCSRWPRLACGVAGSPEMLVLARLVQGIGAALLMPNVLSIIGVTYGGPRLARALGVYGLVMGAGGGQRTADRRRARAGRHRRPRAGAAAF